MLVDGSSGPRSYLIAPTSSTNNPFRVDAAPSRSTREVSWGRSSLLCQSLQLATALALDFAKPEGARRGFCDGRRCRSSPIFPHHHHASYFL